MSKVIVELSTSLDGFIAGPNDGPENGLGDGGRYRFPHGPHWVLAHLIEVVASP